MGGNNKGDGTKMGFLFIIFYPFLTIIGRGAQPMIGGAGQGELGVLRVREHPLSE